MQNLSVQNTRSLFSNILKSKYFVTILFVVLFVVIGGLLYVLLLLNESNIIIDELRQDIFDNSKKLTQKDKQLKEMRIMSEMNCQTAGSLCLYLKQKFDVKKKKEKWDFIPIDQEERELFYNDLKSKNVQNFAETFSATKRGNICKLMERNILSSSKKIDQIPSTLVNDFTMNGQLLISNRKLNPQDNVIKINNLFNALKDFAIERKEVLIIGSSFDGDSDFEIDSGLINSIYNEFSPLSITIIDFHKYKFQNDQIKSYTINEWILNEEKQLFDVGITVFSDILNGLGRFSDPMESYSDVKSLLEMKCMIKENGFLISSIRTSHTDELLWNSQRIYGVVRVPIVFKGWTILQSYGLSYNSSIQHLESGFPVFVLLNESFDVIGRTIKTFLELFEVP